MAGLQPDRGRVALTAAKYHGCGSLAIRSRASSRSERAPTQVLGRRFFHHPAKNINPAAAGS